VLLWLLIELSGGVLCERHNTVVGMVPITGRSKRTGANTILDI